tara:strand:- start:661 stop:4542 length:3882 start_codon:yes stop_codon:yes gene_type:complete
MAEKPWYIGSGAKPQSLDETLDDLKRIGTGLLVGETADILGLPADLIGLYQDLRYGKTSEGVQSLIDQYGSEALAKKFMGEEFPEFGMNLESFGRVVAPGALLSKGIMTARLAARGGRRPPPSGLAMATVGGGKLVDDVPPTTAEQLMMTRADDGGGEAKKITTEENFFEDKIKVGSELNPDQTVFSNLINELRKIGTDQPSRLSLVKPIIRPLEDKQGNFIRDERGKVIPKPTGEVEIKGIDFSKKPTGRELLGYFTNNLNKEFNIVKGKDGKKKAVKFSQKFGGTGLKDSRGSGLQSRLGQEAVETGLIRYLENNPEKVFTRDELVEAASLFNPNIKVTVFSKGEQADIEKEINRLSAIESGETKSKELEFLEKRRKEYIEYNPWSWEDVQNLKVADLGPLRNNATAPVTGRVVLEEANHPKIRTNSHTFLFSGGEESKYFMGRKMFASNEQDRKLAEIDKYFKALGSTTSLKKLLAGSTHGYRIPGYFGHVRGTGIVEITPEGKKVSTLSINEIQSNQALDKQKKAKSQDPKIAAKIARLSDKKANEGLTIEEQAELNRVLQEAGIDAYMGIDKAPNVLTNQTKMDALQIVEEDKKLGTGFVTLAKEKDLLQDQLDKATKKANEIKDELNKLNMDQSSLRRSLFRTDEQLNRDRLLVSDFKNAKEKIIEDLERVTGQTQLIDRDANMPNVLASLFFQNSRASVGPFGTQAGHLPRGRGLDYWETGKLLDLPSQRITDLAQPGTDADLKTLQDISKTRYGTQGNVDILTEVLSDKNLDVASDFDLFDNAYQTGENIGRKVPITDINMLKEYYSDLTEGFKNGLISEEAYNMQKAVEPSYKSYITIKKMVKGRDYFQDPDVVKKTIRLLINDKERKLEAGFLRSQIFNKIMNDPEMTKILESDNVTEIRNRLETLYKNYPDRKGPEYRNGYDKIKNDFKEDLGVVDPVFGEVEEVGDISLRSLNLKTSPLAKAFQKATNEVYDEFRKNQKKIPMLSTNSAKSLIQKSLKGTKKIFDEGEYNKFLGTKQFKEEQLEESYKDFIDRNFEKDMPFLESAIAKKRLNEFKKSREYLENKLNDAEVLEQDATRQIEDFNKEKDLDKVLNDLKNELPSNLAKSLDEIIDHQKRTDKMFLLNTPVMDQAQATELMVHNVIKKAKELGYDRVHFPSMEAYDDVTQREQLLDTGVKRRVYGDDEEKKAYDAVIGKPLTKALKRYGQGYKTQRKVLAESIDLSRQIHERRAQIGKEQTRPNAIDDDLHRIIDLREEEANKITDLKIPRMAKGGILNKFRKAS